MNKQEKEELVNQLHSHFMSGHSDLWDIGYNEGLLKADTIVRNLPTEDEPQKVKVPAFVAEWIEMNKAGDVPIMFILKYFGKWFEMSENKELNDETCEWVIRNPEKFMRAWLDGYEVEEEPKYTVTINLDRKYHLVLDEGDGDDEISTTLTTGHDVLGYRYFLTEKEIKSIDERYWQFALPVEKV